VNAVRSCPNLPNGAVIHRQRRPSRRHRRRTVEQYNAPKRPRHHAGKPRAGRGGSPPCWSFFCLWTMPFMVTGRAPLFFFCPVSWTAVNDPPRCGGVFQSPGTPAIERLEHLTNGPSRIKRQVLRLPP